MTDTPSPASSPLELSFLSERNTFTSCSCGLREQVGPPGTQQLALLPAIASFGIRQLPSLPCPAPPTSSCPSHGTQVSICLPTPPPPAACCPLDRVPASALSS